MKRLALAVLAATFFTVAPALACIGTPGYHCASNPSDAALEDNFTILADYAYAEVVPQKPADIALHQLRGVPEGSVVDEIGHAADAFGIARDYMMAIAKIESDFDPKNRTGSYIGLYQLSHSEFSEYGDGKITDPRDNAMAAASKFTVESAQFKMQTHQKTTAGDLYLVHQQGIEGAVQHITHPDRLAWKSMCATSEGREKGEKWCKRAIWENTLPKFKKQYGSVDNFTSGEFVEMWRERVNQFMWSFTRSMPPVAMLQRHPHG